MNEPKETYSPLTNGIPLSTPVYLSLIKKRSHLESYTINSQNGPVGVFNRLEYDNQVFLLVFKGKDNRTVMTNILREGAALLYIFGIFRWHIIGE